MVQDSYVSAKGKSKAVIEVVTTNAFQVVTGQLSPALLKELDRDFTDAEKERIFSQIGLSLAPSVQTPIVLWVFGPSAVGKTFLANQRAAELFGSPDNAVTVDGAEFRQIHAGFQAVAADGISKGVLHAEAWDILKNAKRDAAGQGAPEQLRSRILQQAVAKKQHLIIPDCATNLTKVRGMMAALAAAGYEMHCIGLWAPLKATRSRGEPRSVREGKQWSPRGYAKAVKGCLELAKHWEKEMKTGSKVYKSVRLWDNTCFPSHEVLLPEFSLLVGMSEAEAYHHLVVRTELAAKMRSDALDASGSAALSKASAKAAFKKVVNRPFVWAAKNREAQAEAQRRAELQAALDAARKEGQVEGALMCAALVAAAGAGALLLRSARSS